MAFIIKNVYFLNASDGADGEVPMAKCRSDVFPVKCASERDAHLITAIMPGNITSRGEGDLTESSHIQYH